MKARLTQEDVLRAVYGLHEIMHGAPAGTQIIREMCRHLIAEADDIDAARASMKLSEVLNKAYSNPTP